MPELLVLFAAAALMVPRGLAAAPGGNPAVLEPQSMNNLVVLLLDVFPAPNAESFPFVRAGDGWILYSFTTQGEGTICLKLDKASHGGAPINHGPGSGPTHEAMHYVTKVCVVMSCYCPAQSALAQACTWRIAIQAAIGSSNNPWQWLCQR
jgi:hypothetical protein